MSLAAANAVIAKARNLPIDVQTAARVAWQNLSYELRDNKGQPFVCPQHPEAVRLAILRGLLDGLPVSAAIDAARVFAFTELPK